MSASDDFNDPVEWFIQVDDADKGRIIEGIKTDGENISNKEAGYARDLVHLIQDLIEEEDREEAIENLSDSGIRKEYASLLVETTLETFPPAEMQIRDLESLSQDKFECLVDYAVCTHIGGKEEEPEVDENDLKTSPEAVFEAINDALMTYLRGENTLTGIEERYKEMGLDEQRAGYITDKFEEYGDMIHRRILFMNIQDIKFRELQDLKDQQRRTRQLMDDVLTILENAAREEDT